MTDAHFKLGCCYCALGKRHEAIVEWQKTLKMHPDHYGARKYLAPGTGGSTE